MNLDLLSLTTTGSFTLLTGQVNGSEVPLASLRDLGDVDLASLFGTTYAPFVG